MKVLLPIAITLLFAACASPSSTAKRSIASNGDCPYPCPTRSYTAEEIRAQDLQLRLHFADQRKKAKQCILKSTEILDKSDEWIGNTLDDCRKYLEGLQIGSKCLVTKRDDGNLYFMTDFKDEFAETNATKSPANLGFNFVKQANCPDEPLPRKKK